jgi:hypothetical protein
MADDEPKAEQQEDWSERVGKILEGAEKLNTIKDGLEIVGLLEAAGEAGAVASGSLLAAAVLGPILGMVAALYSVLEADETQEKLSGARGFAFGVAWGVLGKGTPSTTCTGGDMPQRAEACQEKWNKGASEGAGKGSDTAFSNRCIIWMAHNHDDGTQLVRHIFTDACSHLGLSDFAVDTLASNLSVDSPSC